jgi:hypothetical protein
LEQGLNRAVASAGEERRRLEGKVASAQAELTKAKAHHETVFAGAEATRMTLLDDVHRLEGSLKQLRNELAMATDAKERADKNLELVRAAGVEDRRELAGLRCDHH